MRHDAIGMFVVVALGACQRQAAPRATTTSEVSTGIGSSSSAGTAGAASRGAAATGVTTTKAHVASATAASAPAADSVRGVVLRVGSEPRTQLVVRTSAGPLCQLGSTTRPVSQAIEGLEVTLWGSRSNGAQPMMPGATCAFDVTRFAVRAVDGIAAVDGLLRSDGTSFALETADGARLPLRDVPPSLRASVGARIYWAGPTDRAPAAYGVLVRTGLKP
jgi:hypothetical protein